jgi:hypothetical protein
MTYTRTRSYSELSRIDSFEERFEYLRLDGGVGHSTFGHDRYMNQAFYTSREWRDVRHHVIVRDNGMDLGVDGYPIFDRPVIHHIVPMTPEDFDSRNPMMLSMDNLIMTTHDTHNAIHFGTKALLRETYTERQPGDTILW